MSESAKFEFLASRQFTAWMAEQNTSLAFTTYQAGKLFLLGLQDDGRLEIFNRTFNRSMGLAVSDQTLYLSTLYQLWRFDNSLAEGQTHNGYDRLYVPQMAWTTGDIDIHDIAVDADDRPVFVNTLFGCLATVSDRYSFEPLWKPPFVSRIAAEDRCHLNGFAMIDGKPRYATSVARSDVPDGWRDRRANGGTLIDIEIDEVVCEGLSMPHSPRWHRGRLWLLDSGSGFFGYVDLETGSFEPVTFCPGFSRGLSFIGDYAVVGLSQSRKGGSFSGLALDDALRGRDAEARCGLQIIDLNSGDVVHWLRLKGVIQELYDVAVMPGMRRPMAIGLLNDEIRRTISVAPGDPRKNLPAAKTSRSGMAPDRLDRIAC